MSDNISGDITTMHGGELQLLLTEELAILYIRLLHYKQGVWLMLVVSKLVSVY